jgi:hypothetical protein
MSVASWLLSKWTGAGQQDPSTYKGAIDGNFAVAQQIVAAFAPQQQAVANMTVQVLGGSILDGGALVTVAVQNTANFTAPVTYPRIDRVVLDQRTGAYTTVAGTEANSPAAPAIPAGNMPCAQVLLQTSSTVITNSMITDERQLKSISKAYADATYGAHPTVTTVASVTTPDIWTNTSPASTISYTGTATATGFAAAPVAGSQRKLICTAACLFTAGANLIIEGVPSGTTITLSANAVVDVLAITTTQFKLRYSLSGSFTPTIGGLTTNPVITASYSITNGVCTLWFLGFNGTSNSTLFFMSGFPACTNAIITTYSLGIATDNGSDTAMTIQPAAGGLLFAKGIVGSTTSNWTSTGTKGLYSLSITYPVA